MRTASGLKQLLTQIKDNHYELSDGMEGVINHMLAFIGHTDAELRDKLIYSTFAKWAEMEMISPTQMKQILDTALRDTHLFFDIGKVNTDSVFTRAFSSLLIPIAMHVHNKNPFLTNEDIETIKNAVLRYVALEKDYRGYVDGYGWAHAVAHISDALAALAGLLTNKESLRDILQGIHLLACNCESVYAAEEDERLVTAFMSVANHRIFTAQELIEFIKRPQEITSDSLKNYYLSVNLKHFKRSLYFRLLGQEDFAELLAYLKEELA